MENIDLKKFDLENIVVKGIFDHSNTLSLAIDEAIKKKGEKNFLVQLKYNPDADIKYNSHAEMYTFEIYSEKKTY